MIDYIDPAVDSVYYNPQTNVVRIFWTYFGDVVEIPEYGIGPYYFIGEL
jgi:hypothetical protein